MTAYHNYIVTSLDLHLVELEDFKYSGTNITAFRLVNPDLDEVLKVSGHYNKDLAFHKTNHQSTNTKKY